MRGDGCISKRRVHLPCSLWKNWKTWHLCLEHNVKNILEDSQQVIGLVHFLQNWGRIPGEGGLKQIPELEAEWVGRRNREAEGPHRRSSEASLILNKVTWWGKQGVTGYSWLAQNKSVFFLLFDRPVYLCRHCGQNWGLREDKKQMDLFLLSFVM